MFSLRKVVFIVLFVQQCNLHAYSDFSGKWCWERDKAHRWLSLNLKKVGDRYKGGYHAFAYSKEDMDDNDNAFDFKDTHSSLVQTKIIAGWNKNVGIVQLKLLDNGNMEWLLFKTPNSEFDMPYEAVLKRC